MAAECPIDLAARGTAAYSSEQRRPGRPMQLLHVVPTYFPAVRYGGPIQSIHSLCRALARRGHSVHVCTSSVDGAGDLDVPVGREVDVDGVKVSYFRSQFVRRLYYCPGMRAYLREMMGRIDFVHLHSVFLWPTFAAATEARRRGVPWCVAPRGALVPEFVRHKNWLIKKAWIALLERATLEDAAFLHLTTDLEERNVLRMGIRARSTRVIPNGIDLMSEDRSGNVTHVAPLVPEGRYLLFLGRITWAKGLDRLIPALRQVPSDTRLMIAGNDDEGLASGLRDMAVRYGVDSRVHFMGPVSGELKAALLRSAVALVLPSYSENFGNVILESWSHSRPVVVTAGVGLSAEVRSAQAGFVIPGDPEAMGRAVAEMLKSPQLLDRMGANGRRLVEQKFGWDAVARQMEEAYEAARASSGLAYV